MSEQPGQTGPRPEGPETPRPPQSEPPRYYRPRDEKQDEKRQNEKEEEKRSEKGRGEKFSRDPVRAGMFGTILIWGGIVALIAALNLVKASWWDGWPVFLVGTGVILLAKACYRVATPEHRRPVGGTIIIGLVLIGVGLSDLVGWRYVVPVILIVLGLIFIGRMLFHRSR